MRFKPEKIMLIRKLSLLPLICCLLCGLAWAQEPLRLELGKPVEREIAGGQEHTYQLNLSAGQFLRVVAEQKSIDLALTLVGADGRPLVKRDLTNIIGAHESISFEPKAAGSYTIVVHATSAVTVKGTYQVLLELKPRRASRIASASQPSSC
jgi:hypothetical protein